MITTKQYLQSRDSYYDRKIKRELIGLITFGAIISVFAVFGFARFIMFMVEKGWIN